MQQPDQPRNIYGQPRNNGGWQDHFYQEQFLHEQRMGNTLGPQYDRLGMANDGYGDGYGRAAHGFTDYHADRYMHELYPDQAFQNSRFPDHLDQGRPYRRPEDNFNQRQDENPQRPPYFQGPDDWRY